ncbi:serine aminopeptidase domain-containing protein, partial [Candidatus Paracaedibacter symbiosus]
MHHLSDRGYDVLTLDWRGQGDSGRFTDQRTLLYIDNFDSYVKDLKVF